MKENVLGQIRIISIFECVPGQIELQEFVDITMKSTFITYNALT